MIPTYTRNYLRLKDANNAYTELLNISWVQRESAPRKEYWDTTKGEAYTYGQGRGIRTYEPNEPSPLIAEFRKKLLVDLETDFHGCFLNRYDGQKDWLGWHSDDDPSIDHEKPIAVITLGTGREINWKIRGSKGYDAINRQYLEHGSLFVMPAGMQGNYYHRIPKSDRAVGTRISLTFRSLL